LRNNPKDMKRPLTILAIACILIVGISILAKPFIIALAKKQLANVFVQARVSVGDCALKPTHGLSLFNIEITRTGAYDIKIKEATIRYNLFSIFNAAPLTLFLKDTSVRLNAPEKRIQELGNYLHLGQGRPLVRSAEISNLDLDLNALDLTVKAHLSSGLNLTAQSLDYVDLKIDNFEMLGVQLENTSLKLDPGSDQGDFHIAQLKYDKLIVTDIKGKTKVQKTGLSLSDVTAKALDGDIEGNLDLKIGREPQYLVNLQCTGLDIERLVRDFKLEEKFNMTGRLSGNLKLQGIGAQFKILQGGFSTLAPGGTLVITDTKFLENMARTTQQPIGLLLESFKNYRYNTGLMTLDFSDNNIILKTDLEGEAGKRNLSITVHDFKLKKEEQ